MTITTVKPKRDNKGRFAKGKPDRKTLRELLKEHKEYCQITDIDLALRTGLSLQTIRSYMCGVRKPGLVGVIKLCRELEITLDELAEVQEIWEAI